MPSPSRSHTDTPAERLRENAEHALRFTADGKYLSVWAEDALAVLADLQRLEEALRMTMPYLDRYGSAEERLQALAALHREKPQ